MVNDATKAAGQGQQQAAQMIYLAQLNASKSNCKCEACQLLRKGVDAMTQAVLNPLLAGAEQRLQTLQDFVGKSETDGEAVEV